MGKRPTNWKLWGKVAAAGLVAGIGGPMFTAWLTPSEDEIRARYNPDLRRRSLEGRAAREQEFDEFVTQLKQYSKSDKPMAKEDDDRRRRQMIEAAKTREKEAAARREEMRLETGLESKGDTAASPPSAPNGSGTPNQDSDGGTRVGGSGVAAMFGWR